MSVVSIRQRTKTSVYKSKTSVYRQKAHTKEAAAYEEDGWDPDPPRIPQDPEMYVATSRFNKEIGTSHSHNTLQSTVQSTPTKMANIPEETYFEAM